MFGPGNASIVAGLSDGRVVAWDRETGGMLREFGSQAANVQTAVFSPDDRLLALGHNANFAVAWDTAA